MEKRKWRENREVVPGEKGGRLGDFIGNATPNALTPHPIHNLSPFIPPLMSVSYECTVPFRIGTAISSDSALDLVSPLSTLVNPRPMRIHAAHAPRTPSRAATELHTRLSTLVENQQIL